MKIVDIEVENKALGLLKPYRIANQTIEKVSNCLVKLRLENGVTGLGTGAPIDFVTGETMESCLQALEPANLSWLLQQSIESLPALCKQLASKLNTSPAARAALDIALHDAYSKLCQLPLVDILGREHLALPTSITVGIKDIRAAISEAKDFISRGFKILKIKLGENIEQDLDVVQSLRSIISPEIKIRVDMNQGYSYGELDHFLQNTENLNIELIEQPLNKINNHALKQLHNDLKNKIAADESVVSVQDMFNLVSQERLYGIVNIKLMKCGGISAALNIAQLASLANIDLMWGCMDESIISISAALHAALASRRTKYLDLDGSFDLANDLVQGGFILENGYLRTNQKPGLGVELAD